METLQNYYVQIRQGLVEEDADAERRGRAPRAVPITVRQLEAIVRISESVARMRLSDIATEDDVQQAIRMFTVSTLRAAKMGDIELEGDSGGAERSAEEMIRKRVQIYMVIQKSKLLNDLNAQVRRLRPPLLACWLTLFGPHRAHRRGGARDCSALARLPGGTFARRSLLTAHGMGRTAWPSELSARSVRTA